MMIIGLAVHKIVNNDSLSIAKLVSMTLCVVGLGFVLQPAFLSKLLRVQSSEEQSDNTLRTLTGWFFYLT